MGNVLTVNNDGSDVFSRLWRKNSEENGSSREEVSPMAENEGLRGEPWAGVEKNLCSPF